MPRARSKQTFRQTAAAYDETQHGSGCLSFMLPPLAVLLVGALLMAFSFNVPTQSVQAQAVVTTPAPSVQVQPVVATSAQPVQAEPFAPSSPQIASGQISSVFTPEVQFWSSSITRWAAAANLDSNLVAVIMQIESCGNPFALSRSGAIGLFQVMPYHFFPADDPYAPDTNALRGMSYLQHSLTTANNDTRLAMAGYNGGIGVISEDEWSWPAETIRYAYWGSGIYQDALNNATESGRLNEWLIAGGASLCQQARERLGIN
jgi:hypothetical protein